MDPRSHRRQFLERGRCIGRAIASRGAGGGGAGSSTTPGRAGFQATAARGENGGGVGNVVACHGGDALRWLPHTARGREATGWPLGSGRGRKETTAGAAQPAAGGRSLMSEQAPLTVAQALRGERHENPPLPHLLITFGYCYSETELLRQRVVLSRDAFSSLPGRVSLDLRCTVCAKSRAHYSDFCDCR